MKKWRSATIKAKKWSGSGEEEFVAYLNKLSDKGVPPENIKIYPQLGFENWASVYYFHTQAIEPD